MRTEKIVAILCKTKIIKKSFLYVCLFLLATMVTQCSSSKKTQKDAETTNGDSRGLKDYYKNYFLVGVAVGPSNLAGEEAQLMLKQFNSLTPENANEDGAYPSQRK